MPSRIRTHDPLVRRTAHSPDVLNPQIVERPCPLTSETRTLFNKWIRQPLRIERFGTTENAVETQNRTAAAVYRPRDEQVKRFEQLRVPSRC